MFKPYRDFFVVEQYHNKAGRVCRVRVPKSLGYNTYVNEMKRRRAQTFTTAVLSKTMFLFFGTSVGMTIHSTEIVN